MDMEVAAEPLVPKPASPQFAAALSEAAIASFAAPAIASQLEWVPWGGRRWRYKPETNAKQLTYGEALGDHSLLLIRITLISNEVSFGLFPKGYQPCCHPCQPMPCAPCCLNTFTFRI